MTHASFHDRRSFDDPSIPHPCFAAQVQAIRAQALPLTLQTSAWICSAHASQHTRWPPDRQSPPKGPAHPGRVTIQDTVPNPPPHVRQLSALAPAPPEQPRPGHQALQVGLEDSIRCRICQLCHHVCWVSMTWELPICDL